MPSPVTFDITLAPLPDPFEGTPQQWATALVDRLTVVPQSPWNSFLVGDSVTPIPSSDYGPVLFQGKEWRVWNTSTGAYDYHTQNGAGLVAASVASSKLTGTAGGMIRFNSVSGVGETIAPGLPGQVITMVGSTPAWADSYVPGQNFFEVGLSASQDIPTDDTATRLAFDTVLDPEGATFDTVNNRLEVTAGSIWFFYVALQFEDTGAASTSVQLSALIRKNGSVTGPGTVTNYTTAQSRFGVNTCGVVRFAADGYVDVAVAALETTPSATGLSLADNSNNTRFGGYRIL